MSWLIGPGPTLFHRKKFQLIACVSVQVFRKAQPSPLAQRINSIHHCSFSELYCSPWKILELKNELFQISFLKSWSNITWGGIWGGCNLTFLAPLFRTAEFSLKYFQVLLTIAFHQVLPVGSSPLKFNRFHLMYSPFLYSELCTGKLRWWTTGTHLQEVIILWRGRVKPWWEWALQSPAVDLLKLVQGAFSPARTKRNNLLETSTASKVQWQAERERSSGCNPIKREKIGFPGGGGGGSLCCNSLPDKKQLHLAWEGLLASQKKSRIFQMIDLITSGKQWDVIFQK